MSTKEQDVKTCEVEVVGVTSNAVIKMGGTTVGSIAVGTAIGGLFSPAGAAVGAVLGGVTGVAISAVEAREQKRSK